MPGIENDLNQIRSALYGREVREAIAHGLEQCYTDASEAAENATKVEDDVSGIVITIPERG